PRRSRVSSPERIAGRSAANPCSRVVRTGGGVGVTPPEWSPRPGTAQPATTCCGQERTTPYLWTDTHTGAPATATPSPSPNANSYLRAELVRCTLRVRHPGTRLLARTAWEAARGRGAGAGAAARCGCGRGVRERTGPPPRPSRRAPRANSYRRARLVPCTVRARHPGTSWPTRRGRLREVCREGGLAGLAEL